MESGIKWLDIDMQGLFHLSAMPVRHVLASAACSSSLFVGCLASSNPFWPHPMC